MIAQLGEALVLGALACSVMGAVTGFGAGATRSAEGWRWARRFAYGFAACITLAVIAMEYALITHDFSVRYVAQVGSRATPLIITIVSLWSSLEGSILFWGLILGTYVAIATWLNGEENPETMTWATGTWLAVAAFFCFLLAGPANPFMPAPSPVPLDGPGPNPLLQNHVLMVIHPPMLYLGYVGMAIPFGIAVGALVAARLGAAQIKPLRRWLLVPWIFLTLGITLGGWWAYEVLGWGGYWAWDPVENASLLPWLTATAALHAAMLPHRRGTMKGWTITLVLASFLLTLLGTFMTRSGVFNSVHSFSQSDIGPTLLGFIAVVLVVSLVLLAMRVDRLSGEGEVQAVVSRESAFLVNNLLFVCLTFTVLLGTVFPLVAEAVRGVKLSVGEPYFNRMAVPIGVAILFLMGVGPALPWGEASFDRVRRSLQVPLGVGAAAVGAAWAAGLVGAAPLLTLGCAGFATTVTIRELVAPMRTLGIAGLVLNTRRTGGYVVHIGIILMIVSIAMSSAYRTDVELTMREGECAVFQGHDVCYTGGRTEPEPHRSLRVADFRVDAEYTMSPALATYPGMGTPIGKPAVRSSAGHDLYLSLMNIDPDGKSVGVHLFNTPLVAWIWIGAGVVALGGLIALLPARRAASAAAGADGGAAPIVPEALGT